MGHWVDRLRFCAASGKSGRGLAKTNLPTNLWLPVRSRSSASTISRFGHPISILQRCIAHFRGASTREGFTSPVSTYTTSYSEGAAHTGILLSLIITLQPICNSNMCIFLLGRPKGNMRIAVYILENVLLLPPFAGAC